MPIKLNKLPTSERPYEKLEMYGPSLLSNSELLAIIIKTGTKNETAVDVAQRVLSIEMESDSLRFIQEISIEQLKKIKGIGRIKAVGEIAKRLSKPLNNNNITIKSPQDVANLLMEELRYEKNEILKIIVLNTKNKIQKIQNIAIGGTFSINIEPKDILKENIKMEMPKLIVVHNHPSGNSTPSQ